MKRDRRQISLWQLLIAANVSGIILAIVLSLFSLVESEIEAIQIASLFFVVVSGFFGFIGAMTAILFIVSILLTPNQNEAEKQENLLASGKILCFSVLFAILAPAVLILFSLTVISFTS